jgi:hypothetical protein
MAEVYLVTQGSYSDYHVIGVFSTREAAEACKAWEDHGNSYDHAEIETFELDHFDTGGLVPGHVWRCTIELESGTITDEQDEDEHVKPGERSGTPWFENRRVRRQLPDHVQPVFESEPRYWVFDEIPQVTVHSYVSAEHARKLAAEARQAWLRDRATKPT